MTIPLTPSMLNSPPFNDDIEVGQTKSVLPEASSADDAEDLACDLFYNDEVNRHKVWEFVSVVERRYYRSMAVDKMKEADNANA